jgi:N-acetyl-anhydromuramyl-L-alanine amidase AmpD
MTTIEELIIHHSASPRSTTAAAIRKWHIAAKGWKDIGYHYVIEGDGRIVVGRPLPQTGAHCVPNARRIGVCVSGDNTLRAHCWNKQQELALRDLVDAIRLLWPAIRIMGHRDAMPGHTECPGLDVAEWLDEWGVEV